VKSIKGYLLCPKAEKQRQRASGMEVLVGERLRGETAKREQSNRQQRQGNDSQG
jgi:hypothetical protein